MKIAVLSSHTPSLLWFRLDMMKEFIVRGHQVIALGPEPEEEWKGRFGENGIIYRKLSVDRNGINPLKDIKTLMELNCFMKQEKPDRIFAYQAKTVIYGSIAAKLNQIPEVYLLIAGMGSVFRGKGLKNAFIKKIMVLQYKVACKFCRKVFFQNSDDQNEFMKERVVNEKQVVMINGSGVNLDKFKPMPLPIEPAFLFIGRLIKDKGIMEYLNACKIIKSNYPHIRCLLVGPYDTNPTAIKPHELQYYIDRNVVEYYGEQTDVRPYIAQCSTYVLPSYHEGTPKTVLEAMAMGRAIITSDAPGCRETIIDGENGYLVKVKDIQSVVSRMKDLIHHPGKGQEMGSKSIMLAREKYDVKLVNQTIIQTMGL